MAMGACPGQIPMPCVPPALMVTATMVRACRYTLVYFRDQISQRLNHTRLQRFKRCDGSYLGLA